MSRIADPLPKCICGSDDIEISSDKDLGGLVIYCKKCGAFPERSFCSPSSARRGWKNFIKRMGASR